MSLSFTALFRFLSQCNTGLRTLITGQDDFGLPCDVLADEQKYMLEPQAAVDRLKSRMLSGQPEFSQNPFLLRLANKTSWTDMLMTALAQCKNLQHLVVRDPGVFCAETLAGSFRLPSVHNFLPVVRQWTDLREFHVHLPFGVWDAVLSLTTLVAAAPGLSHLRHVVLDWEDAKKAWAYRVLRSRKFAGQLVAQYLQALDKFVTVLGGQLETLVLGLPDPAVFHDVLEPLSDGRLTKLRQLAVVCNGGDLLWTSKSETLFVQLLANNPKLETVGCHVDCHSTSHLMSAVLQLPCLQRVMGFANDIPARKAELTCLTTWSSNSSSKKKCPAVRFYPLGAVSDWHLWTSAPGVVRTSEPDWWRKWTPLWTAFAPSGQQQQQQQQALWPAELDDAVLRVLPWLATVPVPVWSALDTTAMVEQQFDKRMTDCHQRLQRPLAVLESGLPNWTLVFSNESAVAMDMTAKADIPRGTLLIVEQGHVSVHRARLTAMLLLSLPDMVAKTVAASRQQDTWCPFPNQWSLEDWNRAASATEFVMEEKDKRVLGCFPHCASRTATDAKQGNVDWGVAVGTSPTVFLFSNTDIPKGTPLVRSVQRNDQTLFSNLAAVPRMLQQEPSESLLPPPRGLMEL